MGFSVAVSLSVNYCHKQNRENNLWMTFSPTPCLKKTRQVETQKRFKKTNPEGFYNLRSGIVPVSRLFRMNDSAAFTRGKLWGGNDLVYNIWKKNMQLIIKWLTFWTPRKKMYRPGLKWNTFPIQNHVQNWPLRRHDHNFQNKSPAFTYTLPTNFY